MKTTKGEQAVQDLIQRRQFVRRILGYSLTLPFVGLVLGGAPFKMAWAAKKKTGQAGAVTPLPSGETAVSESDPVAMGMGFKQKAHDIDFSRYPDRKKPSAKNQ